MASQASSVLIVALAAAAIVAPTSGLPSALGSQAPAPRSTGAAAAFVEAQEMGCGGMMRLRGGGFFFVPKPVWPLYGEEEIPP